MYAILYKSFSVENMRLFFSAVKVNNFCFQTSTLGLCLNFDYNRLYNESGRLLFFFSMAESSFFCLWQRARLTNFLPTCSFPHSFVTTLRLSVLLSYAVTWSVSDVKVCVACLSVCKN